MQHFRRESQILETRTKPTRSISVFLNDRGDVIIQDHLDTNTRKETHYTQLSAAGALALQSWLQCHAAQIGQERGVKNP